MKSDRQRQLIVFDLDETLVHASLTDLGHPIAFAFPPYFVYQRPFVAEMLEQLAANYDLAVWSSSSREYVDAVVAQVFGNRYPVKFAWSVERCVQRVDIKSKSYVYIKDLRTFFRSYCASVIGAHVLLKMLMYWSTFRFLRCSSPR